MSTDIRCSTPDRRRRVRGWRALVPLIGLFHLLGAGLASPALAAQLLIDASGAGPGQELLTPYTIAWDPIGERVILPSYENSLVFAISMIGPGTYDIQVILDGTGDGMHPLVEPWGVAVGPDGSVYVSGEGSDNVFRVPPVGPVTQIVDSGGAGPGTQLGKPRGLDVSPAGNVYVAGFETNNVLKITPGGVVSEIIDSGGDGEGNVLTNAIDVAVDILENVYVTGRVSNNVFCIDALGDIRELVDASGDGLGNALSGPWGVDITTLGQVVVAGNASNNVFQIEANGDVAVILDESGAQGTLLDGPVGVATGFGGVTYVGSDWSDAVFQIPPSGPSTVAIDGSGDGMGNALAGPWGVAVDGNGDVLTAGVFSANAFTSAPPAFEPVPGLLAPGLGALLVSLIGVGGLRLRSASTR